MLVGAFIMSYKKKMNDFGNYCVIYLLHGYKLISTSNWNTYLTGRLDFIQFVAHTRKNVCILKWSIDMILRKEREAVITFIDYEATFDTESRWALMRLSEALVSPTKSDGSFKSSSL